MSNEQGFTYYAGSYNKKNAGTSDFKSFNYLENGDVLFSNFDTIKSTKILDSGVYNVSYAEFPDERLLLSVDNSLENSMIHGFPEKEKIDKLFSVFFNPDVLNKVLSLGFYHKVGVLLYGKEGTGKSTIIKHYYNMAIKEYDAIVFYVNCVSSKVRKCWDFISSIRKVQPNPIIIVFEEFDEQMNQNEAFIKTALDGNNSINNCICFAATNYIEKIPPAMKDRPSRFKYVFNIESIQSKEEVRGIINKILLSTASSDEIDGYAKELSGQTLDHIKQFCFDKIMDLNTHTLIKKSIGFNAGSK